MPNDLRAVAERAAKAGGVVLIRSFNNLSGYQHKGGDPNDLVTAADIASEQAIIAVIGEAFPDHRIIAEESGDNGQPSDVVWVIDPLDATGNFVQGIPFFTVSIAVFDKERLCVGVLYDPLRDEIYVAEHGRGATLNDRPIHVSETASLKDVIGGFGAGHANVRLLETLATVVPQIGRARILGCSSLQAAYVATGQLDLAYLIHLNLYDLAAGMLLVEEAGGKVSHTLARLAPHARERFDVVVSNNAIHDELTPLLRQDLPARTNR